jgi:hypothetical protein
VGLVGTHYLEIAVDKRMDMLAVWINGITPEHVFKIGEDHKELKFKPGARAPDHQPHQQKERQ